MERFTATVQQVERLSGKVSCIDFTVSDKGFTYTAGQYITVYFDGSSQPAGKAYSLAGLPTDTYHRIIVKDIGEFSGMLCALEPGDSFVCSSGYGHLNPRTDKPLLCLSGGIGIAPVWSIIRNELANDPERQVQLVHSHRSVASMPCRSDITKHAASHVNLTANAHITQQPQPPKHMKKGRIELKDYLTNSLHDYVYVLCGSVEFVRNMWQELVAHGVRPQNISAESFFE